MPNSAVERWFLSLKNIWINKDIENIGTLLSSEFRYYEDPFGPPLVTLDEVKNAWKGVSDQDILKLEIRTLIEHENEGSATYEFSYKDVQGNTHDSKGAYFVMLDGRGRAIEFRQWWVGR
ncbi:MAG: hypothetical protein HGB37_01420 [Candidatus Moranbacteria bacterium]|nr:hypothetical protein [Candidatus Moranbacteria bacterium]